MVRHDGSAGQVNLTARPLDVACSVVRPESAL